MKWWNESPSSTLSSSHLAPTPASGSEIQTRDRTLTRHFRVRVTMNQWMLSYTYDTLQYTYEVRATHREIYDEVKWSFFAKRLQVIKGKGISMLVGHRNNRQLQATSAGKTIAQNTAFRGSKCMHMYTCVCYFYSNVFRKERWKTWETHEKQHQD